MLINSSFDRLNAECQRTILVQVGRWLGYRDIKILVSLFNGHNKQPNVDQIKVPELLTEIGFIKAIYAARHIGHADNYLNLRLIEIVRTRDTLVSEALVRFPFNSLQCFPPDHFCEILKNGAKNGHTDLVYDLISNETISEENCRLALELAIENKHKEIVSDLLNFVFFEQEDNQIRNEGDSTSSSMEGGRLKLNHSEPKNACAPNQGNYPIVFSLLTRNIISEKDRSSLVKWIAINGGIDLIRQLKNIFSDFDRSLALYYAAELGDLEIVIELLKNWTVSEEVCGKALNSAARNGHKKVIQELLKKRRIHSGDLVLALQYASQRGDVAVVIELLKDWEITQEICGKAVYCAVINGHKEVVKELLKRKSISIEDRVLALEFAAQRRDMAVVIELVKDCGITEKMSGLALE